MLGSRLPVLIAVLGIALAACTPTTSTAIAASGLERQPDGWRGIPVERELRIPSVTLETTDGRRVVLADEVSGTPTLLFFGYTHCPDVCPIQLAAISSSMRTVGVGFDEIDVVFVSVDPDRDTPQRIEQYLENFDRDILGLHGDAEVVADALGQLEMSGPVVEGPDPRGEGDLIGHPSHVIGFDADGTAQRVWPFGARRSDWVDDLPRIVEQWT